MGLFSDVARVTERLFSKESKGLLETIGQQVTHLSTDVKPFRVVKRCVSSLSRELHYFSGGFYGNNGKRDITCHV